MAGGAWGPRASSTTRNRVSAYSVLDCSGPVARVRHVTMSQQNSRKGRDPTAQVPGGRIEEKHGLRQARAD